METPASTLVIHCSDPRYQRHFNRFLIEDLRLDRYALVAIPGGAQTLTLSYLLPKFAWAGWRWMKFLRVLASPKRIILIGHDDCRWYVENRFVKDENRLRSSVTEDLQKVKQRLAEEMPGASVELYFATLTGDGATFNVV